MTTKIKNQDRLMMFCPLCKVKLNKYKKNGWDLSMHTCGETYCNNCKTYYHSEEQEHKCYMHSIPDSKNNNEMIHRFIFYDFESMLLPSGNHEPNLVVAHSICENCCLDTGKTQHSKCSTCGHHCNVCSQYNNKKKNLKKNPVVREMIFRGKNTVKDFCQWLFSSQHKNIIAIPHNARSYDAYFLYKYIINQSMIQNIFQGSKIMYCHLAVDLNIKLLDSLNFLNMPLSKLPKSFGLKEMSKGYFPHLYSM